MRAPRDDNRHPVLLGVSSIDGVTPVVIYANPTTGAMLVEGDFGDNYTSVFDQDYTVLSTDGIIGITGNSDNLYFTLPDPTTLTPGKKFTFKIQYADLGGFSIYIRPFGSEKIDTAVEFQMKNPFESISVYTDGTNWFIL